MTDNRAINGGLHKEDLTLAELIWATFERIGNQSSTHICQVLIDRVVSFALTTTLETDVSGRIFSSIAQAFSVVS